MVREIGSDNKMNESIDGEGTNFFHIPFACELMQKSTTQVLKQCTKFNAMLFTTQDMRALEVEMFADDEDDKVFKIHQQYNAKISFHCTFKIQDYESFCFVSFNFINDTAVECVISLGQPCNLERYSSEKSVTRVFIVALEKLYLNGRIQHHLQERVYTWKKDNRTLVSFVSYSPSGPTSTDTFLSVQIRDTQLHPQRRELELLYYNKTQKRVENLKWVQENRRGIPFEKIYKNRRTLYRLTSSLFIGMVVLSVVGIISLFSKNFVAAIVLIVLGTLCGYFTSKLYSEAVKDYLHEKHNKADTNQNKENC